MIERTNGALLAKVEGLFVDRGFRPTSIKPRIFPNETIIVVELEEEYVADAIKSGSDIEAALPESFILVIRKAPVVEAAKRANVASVNDTRVSRLIELLNERSRTSEH
jgi:hypothetical protein